MHHRAPAGPFAGMTAEQIAELDDAAYDALMDADALPGGDFDPAEDAA